MHEEALSNLFLRSMKMRNRSLDLPLPQKEDLTNISNFWKTTIDDISSVDELHLTRSTIIYDPNYESSNRAGEKHVKSHLDIGEISDVRIVEIGYGSGTILFSDDDYEVNDNNIELKSNNVRLWEIPVGASVVIRTLSELTRKMGARPCVHAHGLGKKNEKEQRIITKNDALLRYS